MKQWFLAQTKPNAEHIAKRNLERQGFLTFHPLERSTVSRGGRFREQLRPFFAGYIFLAYRHELAPWSVVNSTYGVARLVRFGENPAPVAQSVIAALRAACDENDIVSLHAALTPRAQVEVTLGAFSGFIGEVERLTPDQRALVLLDFIGKHTRVNLPTGILRAASGRTKLSGF